MTTSKDTTTAAGARSRACARYRQSPPVAFEGLAVALGPLLRAERLAGGWSVRRLARAVPCAPSTLWRLETGRRRPRPSLLRSIAAVLHVDGDPRPLAARLIAAAGDELAADSDRTERWRVRRAQDAILAGDRPLSSELARRIRLHRAASASWQQATAIIHQRGALDDPERLAEAQRLLEVARQLRAQAGPAVVVRLGRHEIRAGWGE